MCCSFAVCSSLALGVSSCDMARKFLGVELVDILHVPLERRLQTLAVCCYLFMYFLLAVSCGIMVVWLCFTPLYFIPLIYASWLIYDYRTPECGGRRCEWVRSWTLWRYCRDYFPVTLKSTASLDPSKNYLMIYHPHGILACGACVNFATNATDFHKHFPGIRCSTAALKFQFMFPFCREYALSLGQLSTFVTLYAHSILPRYKYSGRQRLTTVDSHLF